MDKISIDDTLRISINYSIELNQQHETVLVYKTLNGIYFAEIENDTLKKTKKELSKTILEKLKEFEIAVRNQNLKANTSHNYHYLVSFAAEYQLEFKEGLVEFTSREEYYSIILEILNKK